jgi:hypothetical protein
MTSINAQPLRLLAEDADDLAVISAALQDAVGKVGDIAYDPNARTLTAVLNRYRWEAGGGERVRTALQLGSVLNVQSRKVRRGAADGILDLLALTFEPGLEPGGAVVLSFAGGADLRIEVECVDAVLADVSAAWPTPRRPKHAN